jgi:hypothetical protein
MSNQYKNEINIKFKNYFSEIMGFQYRLDHFLDVIESHLPEDIVKKMKSIEDEIQKQNEIDGVESGRGFQNDRPEVIMKWIPFLYELKDKYIKDSKRHLELLTGLESEWNKEKIVRGELQTIRNESLLDGLFEHFWSNRDYRIKELLNVKELLV